MCMCVYICIYVCVFVRSCFPSRCTMYDWPRLCTSIWNPTRRNIFCRPSRRFVMHTRMFVSPAFRVLSMDNSPPFPCGSCVFVLLSECMAYCAQLSNIRREKLQQTRQDLGDLAGEATLSFPIAHTAHPSHFTSFCARVGKRCFQDSLHVYICACMA